MSKERRGKERGGKRNERRNETKNNSPGALGRPRVGRQRRVEQRRRGLGRRLPVPQLPRHDVRGALVGEHVPDAVAGEEEEGVPGGELGRGDVGLSLSLGGGNEREKGELSVLISLSKKKNGKNKAKRETHRHHLLVPPKGLVPLVLQVSDRPRQAQVAIDPGHAAERGNKAPRSADTGGLGRRRGLVVDRERPRPPRPVAQHRARVSGVRDVDGLPPDDGGDDGGAARDDAFLRRREVERRRARGGRGRRWPRGRRCCRCCCCRRGRLGLAHQLRRRLRSRRGIEDGGGGSGAAAFGTGERRLFLPRRGWGWGLSRALPRGLLFARSAARRLLRLPCLDLLGTVLHHVQGRSGRGAHRLELGGVGLGGEHRIELVEAVGEGSGDVPLGREAVVGAHPIGEVLLAELGDLAGRYR